MQLPSAIVYFSLFDDGPVDTQILALMTGSQCIVSDTQMNVKALGPLVLIYLKIQEVGVAVRIEAL